MAPSLSLLHPPEHARLNPVDATLVDQTSGKHLATDIASGDLDCAATRELPGLF